MQDTDSEITPAEPGPATLTAAQSGSTDPAPAFAFDRRDWFWLAIILLLALGLRLAHNHQMSHSPLFDRPILDAEVHDTWARAILEGETYFHGAYFKAPLYPWFLSVLYAVSDGSYHAPRIAQAILGALSCGLMYLLGREIFRSRAIGALAGLAGASYWIMIWFDGELLLEPLSVFLNLAALLAIFRAARHGSLWRWAIAGLLLGISAINRPNILPFVPVIAFWCLFQPGDWLRGLARAMILGLATLLPILPITARNLIVGNDLVLIASQGGANFYIGNNSESDGMSARMPGARTSWGGGYSDWMSLAEMSEGRKLKSSEVDQFFYDQAWDWIQSNRMAAVNLMFRKLQIFFWEGEIVNNQDMTFMTERFESIARRSPLREGILPLARLPLTTGMILPFALLGFFMCLGRPWKTFPLWTFVVIYTATVVAFFVCTRFRLPVMPLAILLAAFAVVRIAETVRDRQFAPAAGYLILIGLFWVAINRGVPEPMRKYDGARALCQLATAYAQDGDEPEQLKCLNEALEVHPDCIEAESSLGLHYLHKKDYPAATRHFTKALQKNPATDVYERLAEALIMQGRWGEAIDYLEQGIEVYHGYLDLKRKLAFVLSTCPIERHRNGHRALRLAEEVRKVGPQYEGRERPETYDTLGVAYAELGRFEDALRAARQALDLAREQFIPSAITEISARIVLYQQGRPFRQHIPVAR